MNISFILAHIGKDTGEILGKLFGGKPQAALAATRAHGYNATALVVEKFLSAVVTCPFCGWRGLRFRAVDDERHVFHNVQCPRCEASGRHRFLLLYLDKCAEQGAMPEGRLLHIAPEASLLGYFLGKPRLRVFLTDLMAPKLAPHGQPKFRSDLRQLAMKNDTMDQIVCVHVLEHIDDDRQAVRELYRILKPGGKAIFMVPADAGLMETIEYDPSGPLHFGHLRDYSPKDTPGRLAPFVVTTIAKDDFLPPEEQLRYGIHDYDFIFLAEKKS